MGISLPLSFKSIANKAASTGGVSIKNVLYKITKRSCLLFFFGLVTSNDDSKYLTHLRIMGVLQRFAISYFVCAILELIFFSLNNFKYLDTTNLDFNDHGSKILFIKERFKEFFLYPIQWLIVSLITLIWLLLTFLLPVPGCPTGYLGPGGLHQNA